MYISSDLFTLFHVAFCTVYKTLFPNYSKRICMKSELQWEFFPWLYSRVKISSWVLLISTSIKWCGPSRVKFIVRLAFTVRLLSGVQTLKGFHYFKVIPFFLMIINNSLGGSKPKSAVFFLPFLYTLVSLYCIHIYFIVGVVQKSYCNVDQMVD